MKFDKHDNFRSQLIRFIHKRSVNRQDLIPSLILPQSVLRRNARMMVEAFEKLSGQPDFAKNKPLQLSTPAYAGRNRHVKRLMAYLDRHLKDDLYGAYVHGSLGSYERVAYSDFDALVILKNEVFDCAERLMQVANKLRKATSIMYAFDPLQHHGWFVLTEADLQCYPESYFPHELFFQAKSLLGDCGRQFTIYHRDEREISFKQPFLNLSHDLLAKLEQNRYPGNAYQLKNLLSQFMLLPALYLQACNGRGIYKKFSFAEASKDFSLEQWAIMDEVSEMTAFWHYKISFVKRRLLSSGHLLLRRYAELSGPAIPPKLRNLLTLDFYQRMLGLIVVMQERLKCVASTQPAVSGDRYDRQVTRMPAENDQAGNFSQFKPATGSQQAQVHST